MRTAGVLPAGERAQSLTEVLIRHAPILCVRRCFLSIVMRQTISGGRSGRRERKRAGAVDARRRGKCRSRFSRFGLEEDRHDVLVREIRVHPAPGYRECIRICVFIVYACVGYMSICLLCMHPCISHVSTMYAWMCYMRMRPRAFPRERAHSRLLNELVEVVKRHVLLELIRRNLCAQCTGFVGVEVSERPFPRPHRTASCRSDV
jgi:hypothetical protein